jgi:multiple sugar transport system permease protein
MASMEISQREGVRTGARRRLGPRLLVLPLLIGLAVFSIYPLVYLAALSISKSLLGSTFQEWVGGANFRAALDDAVFTDSLKLSVLFAIPVSFVELVAGLGIALLVHGQLRGGRIIRTLILLPLITPPIMIATAWKLIFNPAGGLLNSVLQRLGLIDQPISFLGSSDWALRAVGLADAWQWTPFVALLAFAALQSLPEEIFEAAATDGASVWKRFWTITLPMLAPALIAIYLIKLIISFKVFDLVYGMTFGGPGFDTNLASFQIYRVGLQQFNVGYAAAQTLIFGLLVGLITMPIVFLRDWSLRRWQ